MHEDLLKGLNHRDEIHTSERAWDLWVADIADYRGITAHLDKDIWLDWHDILAHPEEARMHMYPGGSKDVSLALKRVRMETWQAAILVFDSMMVDREGPLTGTQIKILLKQQKIPRPQRVVLPTSNPSLLKLFDTLGIWENDTDRSLQITDWHSFAELARDGALLQPKRYLKHSAEHTLLKKISPI